MERALKGQITKLVKNTRTYHCDTNISIIPSLSYQVTIKSLKSQAQLCRKQISKIEVNAYSKIDHCKQDLKKGKKHLVQNWGKLRIRKRFETRKRKR